MERNPRRLKFRGQARVFNPNDEKRHRVFGAVAEFGDFFRRKDLFEPFDLDRAIDGLVAHDQFGNLTFFDQGLELTVADGFDLLGKQRVLREKHQRQGDDEIGDRKILLLLFHDAASGAMLALGRNLAADNDFRHGCACRSTPSSRTN